LTRAANAVSDLVIGYWNLDIVCYLLFGTWNFFSKTPLFLDMLFDFF